MRNPLALASLALAACIGCGGSPAPPRAGASAPPSDAALPPGHPPVAPAAAPAPAEGSAQASVAGRVLLAPALAAGPGDVLYLIAKQGQVTLAVQRIEKPAFPLDFELSEADAMVSGAAFEGPLDIVARLSKSGDAIPAKGDLEGVVKGVAVPAAGISVTIDTARP